MLVRTYQMGPQSNQRGIETPDLDRPLDGAGEGLNRTSVGLKLDPFPASRAFIMKPQSNQRGIET